MSAESIKVSGFTFIRNGVKFDYPFEESLLSLLPVVDELIIFVGKGDDETLHGVKAIAAADPKIRIFESVWDDSLRRGGAILAQQTNLAIEQCRGKWGIYLQADEVLHEEDYLLIREAIERASKREEVDGIIFRYVHFYGDFFVVNMNTTAYRHEVRCIRLNRGIVSWKDAQGFRRKVGDKFEKLRVLRTPARIFHYGWVRPPEVMREKTIAMDKLYHADGSGTGDNYRYKRIFGLERFTGSHPKVMGPRVEAKRWKVDLMATPMIFTWKDIRKLISRSIEKATGWLPGEYKNYRSLD